MGLQFEIVRTAAGGGRRGMLTPPHGAVETPVFMPVGTAASVKASAAERELAGSFRQIVPGTWEMRLKEPIRTLTRGKLTVQVADNDRNVSRIERTFSVR